MDELVSHFTEYWCILLMHDFFSLSLCFFLSHWLHLLLLWMVWETLLCCAVPAAAGPVTCCSSLLVPPPPAHVTQTFFFPSLYIYHHFPTPLFFLFSYFPLLPSLFYLFTLEPLSYPFFYLLCFFLTFPHNTQNYDTIHRMPRSYFLLSRKL